MIADLERVRHDDPLVPARADGPDVRTVLMRMVAAGLRAGSSGTRPDVKRPVSLTVARANGTCRQSHARRRRAPTVRTAARLWLCPGVLPGVYEPRSAAGTVLHQVVRTHLERFLAETAAATDGVGVPRFIEREFRDFLDCGALGRGFARVRCDACRFERLVPFSCKGRGGGLWARGHDRDAGRRGTDSRSDGGGHIAGSHPGRGRPARGCRTGRRRRALRHFRTGGSHPRACGHAIKRCAA